MPHQKAATKAINLRIEYEHEQLVRDVIGRIRTGGPGFRSALRALIDDDKAAEYVPAKEIHSRFSLLERQLRSFEVDGESYLAVDEIEARLVALESRLHAAMKDIGSEFVPANDIQAKFDAMERRLQALEEDKATG
ncbi:hypothetical protein CLV78_11226 [Aliiruegeria haliotis]|uniref:Uncharacterized protein n=1 Tax=Aliiruegeria haliotis TaxID=1280846 RepID=A0A2T0RHK2_9RHOB|nr:hypothetical protein [Aliiruegeria haliotis]PRY20653.1 hypothetical protein CLV78_11226 [Aliiruegeria haliotis]